jgi:Fe2+ transport system protein FeoA
MVEGSTSPARASGCLATIVRLLDLAPGTTAILRQVLGLTDGARLRVCRLGDPCIIQVRSTRIGLSKAVAQSVFVTVTDRDVR